MLLERIVLDQKEINEVLDQSVIIEMIEDVNLDDVSRKMIEYNYKFIIVTNGDDSAIITANDLLAIKVKELKIETYLKERWVKAISIHTKIREFLNE